MFLQAEKPGEWVSADGSVRLMGNEPYRLFPAENDEEKGEMPPETLEITGALHYNMNGCRE